MQRLLTGYFLLALGGSMVGCAAVLPQSTMTSESPSVATLVVHPHFIGARSTQAVVIPYTQASIARLDVIPYLMTAVNIFQPISATTGLPTTSDDPTILKVSQSGSIDVDRSVILGHLKPRATYRIVAQAFNSNGDLISTNDANSYVQVTLGNNDRPAVSTLPVKLIDKPFAAQTTVALGVASNNVDHLVASLVPLANGHVAALETVSTRIPKASLPKTLTLANLHPNTSYQLNVAAQDDRNSDVATTSVPIQVADNTSPASQSLVLTIPPHLGTFSPVSSTLTKPRIGHASVIVGNYLYVIGGRGIVEYNNNETPNVNVNTAFISIERAQINDDGSLGSFSTVPSTLVSGRSGAAAVVIGNFVYIIGGAGTDYPNMVEQAIINSDGSLGPFSTIPSTLIAGRYAPSCIVIGNNLYVIGGLSGPGGVFGSTSLDTVERATINSDGTLGQFSTLPNRLVIGRGWLSCAVVGNNLYVVGGESGSLAPYKTIERSSIYSDGTLGPFSLSPVSLMVTHSRHTCAVVGNYLYVIGSGGTSTTEGAVLGADGSLGSFSPRGGNPVTDRWYHTSVAIGNHLYLIGGASSNGYLNSIERASIE